SVGRPQGGAAMIGGMGGGGGMGRAAAGGGGANLDRVHDIDDVEFNGQNARRSLEYVKPYKWQIFWALALTTFATVMNLLGPYLVKVAIDQYITAGDIPGLSEIVVLTLFVYLANFWSTSRQIVIMSEIGQEILMTLRAQMF